MATVLLRPVRDPSSVNGNRQFPPHHVLRRACLSSRAADIGGYLEQIK